MMKRTRLAFLAAMGLYLAALVLPREAPDDVVAVPLDLAGIDEVEVVAPSGVGLLFSSEGSPTLQYPAGVGHHVTVTRQGRRLRIVSDVDHYHALDIRLTPAVRRLVVPEAAVGTDIALQALVIEVSGDLQWSGDVAELKVIDTFVPRDARPPAARVVARESAWTDDECGPACRTQLNFSQGRIGHLAVTTRQSMVSLNQVDTIQRTTLTLGGDARFSIGQASRIPDITLLPHPADAQTPEARKP